jgi:hypothetical protein
MKYRLLRREEKYSEKYHVKAGEKSPYSYSVVPLGTYPLSVSSRIAYTRSAESRELREIFVLAARVL